MVILFEKKEDCSACGACKSICPMQAISMQPDEYGFLYPAIQTDRCIACHKCINACRFGCKEDKKSVRDAYAAATKNEKAIRRSASGGVFSALAQKFLEDNGAVYGAAMIQQENELCTKHIRVDDVDQLRLLQGSKYVQSNTDDSYVLVKQDLVDGKPVLFSGTPCQIVGLKGYLGKEYQNLCTVDIICHGVPSSRFFNAYLSRLNQKYKGQVRDFLFRDKSKGWGLHAKYEYINKRGRKKAKSIPAETSSYFDMFLKAEIYRENCYVCPYASRERVGDITLGDYWGVQREHPEIMRDAGGPCSENDGISCVLVNTEKGQNILNRIADDIHLFASTINKIANENGQLSAPGDKPQTREMILHMYHKQGYGQVDQYFKKRTGLKIHYYHLKSLLPRSFKKKIKNLLRK